jgi:multiple sugar transport system substrate-binding protein
VPPEAINWNDADDNNAFHAKQIVMDLDGKISTEVALYHKKEDYDGIVTMGLALSNDGTPVPSQANSVGLQIPKGAKNVEVAKDFTRAARRLGALMLPNWLFRLCSVVIDSTP